MSSLTSSSTGFSGRQPDNVQNIKQFQSSPTSGTISWIFKKLFNTNISVITPSDQKKTVMIPKNLLVLGSIINASDIKLKENIKSIDINNDDFMKLNPVSFQIKNDSQNENHYGLIAEELEIIYPELVSNYVNYKTINYVELIPILISQMQNMQKEIILLKRQINDLNNL